METVLANDVIPRDGCANAWPRGLEFAGVTADDATRAAIAFDAAVARALTISRLA
ncbi:MAG: hypothetical protein H0V78_04700 [Burkholderiales bacterium]|nr:hypothetical protein [Burkholderiales bacterium]